MRERIGGMKKEDRERESVCVCVCVCVCMTVCSNQQRVYPRYVYSTYIARALPCPMIKCSFLQSLVRGQSIVCTPRTSRQIYLPGRWGINLINSHAYEKLAPCFTPHLYLYVRSPIRISTYTPFQIWTALKFVCVCVGGAFWRWAIYSN